MKFKVIVDRIEGDKVVLIHNQQEIIVPKNFFVDREVREGQVWFLCVTQEVEEQKSDNQLAKDILNEILNPGE